jgi:hypothetical protein
VAVPDAVDVPADTWADLSSTEHADALLEADPFADDPDRAGAFDGAAERSPDQHPMTEADHE